ncbi:capsule biosynthesis protein [Reyranella sp.]|uniref:capsule biosynthesis protein n=1 Tax=Reyranella sp. TaxID=1929291 RepID=UPI003C7D4379
MPDASQFAPYARMLQLMPVSEAVSGVSVAPASEQTIEAARARRPHYLLSLFLLIVLPTCLTATYLYGFAANRFESEARFVLRMPGRSASALAVPTAVQGQGMMRSSDDGYVVQDFLQSRDAMAWLEEHADLQAAVRRAPWDPLWRFPAVLGRDTQEALFKYFRRIVSITFDTTTGVSTLAVQAFEPDDAQRLVNGLLAAAEGLVNRMNERARRDAIGIAQSEVDRQKRRAEDAQAALKAFRERERLIDPTHATLTVLETIAKLSQEAAQVGVQLGELTRASPDAPQISGLRLRRAALEEQIDIERRRLAGDALAVAPRIAEYERLSLEREFAERTLISAMTMLESARVEALRQQVYLERVATPSKPDYHAYPWRLLWCLVAAVGGTMAWLIWRVIKADALRHTES